MSFEGKTAIITGASKGIGFETAKYFLKNGAEVVFSVKNQKQFSLPPDIENSKRAFVTKTDVTKIEEIKKMTKQTIKQFGKIDILVNNAGVDQPCNLLDITEKHLDYVMDVNFKGTVFCSKYVAKEMVKKEYGKIINLSSIAGKEGTPLHSAYAASKHAVAGFTKCIARELIKHNINVNAVCPGLINTNMLKNYFKDYAKMINSSPEKELNKMIENTPRGKIGEPKDVTELIGFLASDRSQNIVGQTINVGGGILQH